MPTLSFYNHTANLFQSGEVAATDTFMVVLLDATSVFDATHTTQSEATDSGADEVYGNGWAQGGTELTNVTIAVTETDGSVLAADDISVAISGSDLAGIDQYIIVDTTAGMAPLVHVQLDTALTVPAGANAVLQWNAAGIIKLAPQA